MRKCIGQTRAYPLKYENGETVKTPEFIKQIAEIYTDRGDRARFIAHASRIRGALGLKFWL